MYMKKICSLIVIIIQSGKYAKKIMPGTAKLLENFYHFHLDTTQIIYL
jgi:hypothetical protein